MVFKSKNGNAHRAENVFSSLLHKADNNKTLENSKNKIVKCKQNSICCLTFSIFMGTILVLLGVLTIFKPLYNWALNQELAFNAGFPPFELWYHNDVIIRCKVHVFNFTNTEAFEKGIDKKLKIQEIGPIIFHEREIITNPVWNRDNSTLSYNMKREPVFVDEWNQPGILNQTITVPNLPLLFMIAFLYDYNTFTRMGFNLMSKNDPLFINTTIYNYLFNLTTPALDAADKYFPFLVPANNAGLLKAAYENAPEGDNFNVKIGVENGPLNFFKMNTFNYRTTAPGFHLEKGDCDATIVNSTEGNVYGTQLQKDDILLYWRKSVCRLVPLYFEKETEEHSFKAYKYVTKVNMYDRTENLQKDCFSSFNGKVYPDGMSDASHCYKGLPIVMSLPHFYGRDGYWNDKIEGYTPSREKHTSFAIIEPTLGIPLHQRARTQSNLVISKMYGFRRELNIFNDMVIPVIWIEYSLEDLTTSIVAMMTLIIKILPIGQYFITAFLIVLGVYLIYLGLKKYNRNKRQNLEIKLITDAANISELTKLNESNNICIDLDLNLNKNDKDES